MSTVREHMVDELARLRCADNEEISSTAVTPEGDVVMDSLEGVYVIARMEDVLGVPLGSLGRLMPEQYKSLNELAALIDHAICQGFTQAV